MFTIREAMDAKEHAVAATAVRTARDRNGGIGADFRRAPVRTNKILGRAKRERPVARREALHREQVQGRVLKASEAPRRRRQ